MDANALNELTQLRQEMENFSLRSDIQRPWITLSFGMSLDGKIATYTGDSKYISGPLTRAFVHELRHRHDGILVGIRTIEADHPLLTTRLNDGQGRNPHRIILDSQLRIELDEPVLQAKIDSKTIIATKANHGSRKIEALKKLGVTILLDPTASENIDLTWLMSALKANQIHSLLVEGGGTIHESFIKKDFFDCIYAQISPIIIGGKDAKTPVEGLGFATLKESSRVAFHNHFILGSDIILVAKKGR
ncbi:MAG: Riboflavin biosynthesis protein RibD [Bacillota bacterium]|jgi:diaminohydroxyphosphoribosylaminopyrimidine deaminase/5-amino-6-(5-phosphoribosylamino)uracil reductase